MRGIVRDNQGIRIQIEGLVQGVGFRPFVYALANRLSLTGWVRNTSAGVDIEATGSPQNLNTFTKSLRDQAPPLARIEEMRIESCQTDGYLSFEIIHSEAISDAFQPISPDVSICADCLRELFDPDDRRFRYPFINCTNCGPRFTIIQDIPYDRPNTTMAGFPMCSDCKAEYRDPINRRFHAQPVACPVCGPQVWLEPDAMQTSDQAISGYTSHLKIEDDSSQIASGEDAIQLARALLQNGKILAVKGLGGFHLACDATNPTVVGELRRRKLRVEKAFALMAPDVDTIAAHCFVSLAERDLLENNERPIVILRRRSDSPLAAQIAPGQDTLGFMLPYTPLHHLLLENGENPVRSVNVIHQGPPILVMTSGNLSEEPIVTGNDEARQRLVVLADAYLMHNRPIQTRCDDSVMRVLHAPDLRNKTGGYIRRSFVVPLRRSRGYAPSPVRLPWESPPILATGAELKNTFCITRSRYAFLSQHIGDMENYETLRSFEEGVDHFQRLFRIRPELIAFDLHPNYMASRYAGERAEREKLPSMAIQHHHAHIAACMVEHHLPSEQEVIGIAFDGAGYGEDEAIWGGEFLISGYSNFRRAFHLSYYPLPGGDIAVRKPARTALAYLWQAGMDWEPLLPPVEALSAQERTVLRSQLELGLNTPLTSSMGRLFDAVSALVGIRQKISYEAQAAIELESLVDPTENGYYEFDLSSKPGEIGLIEPARVLKQIQADLNIGIQPAVISAMFHNGVARLTRQICDHIRSEVGLREVVLSGGVWQNITLLNKTLKWLEEDGFTVYFHKHVPANDGGLALGQAAIAFNRF
jgi:hydrogenase maturation protein HypF